MTRAVVIRVLRGMVQDVHVIELGNRRSVISGPGVGLVLHQDVGGDAHGARVVEPGRGGVLSANQSMSTIEKSEDSIYLATP